MAVMDDDLDAEQQDEPRVPHAFFYWCLAAFVKTAPAVGRVQDVSPQDRSREIKELLNDADEAGRRVRRHGASAAKHLRAAAARISAKQSSGRHVSRTAASSSR